VDGVREHTKTHKDLEWFGSLEHNTLRSFFCIAPARSWSTELEKASVCDLSEEGLSLSRIAQA
jgi:hypothetical protein